MSISAPAEPAQKTLRVAALTSGRDVPSTRFRVRQHIPRLETLGVHVHEYIPAITKTAPLPILSHLRARYTLPLFLAWQGAKLLTRMPGMLGSRNSDVIWLQREILPGHLTLERFLSRPFVFDVDDAVWMAKPNGRKGVAETARRAAIVVAGNQYLADWFSQHTSNVRIVPTAVDTDRYQPAPVFAERKNFTVGWTGIASNYKYLYEIEEGLAAFFDAHKDAKFLLVAEAPPKFQRIAPEQIEFVPWSPENEATILQRMDVGLMPLPDDEWTRGKCSFKMLQYMACALPVIVSPVGMNVDVLKMDQIGLGPGTTSEWRDALETVYTDHARARAWGEAGRRLVETRFSGAAVATQLQAIFQEVAAK